MKEIQRSLELKSIGFTEQKQQEKIANLISENFYSKTQGVNLRTLKLKIKEGIHGRLSSSSVQVKNLEIKIFLDTDDGQLIAEVCCYSAMLMETIPINKIVLSPSLIGKKEMTHQSNSSTSSSSNSSNSSTLGVLPYSSLRFTTNQVHATSTSQQVLTKSPR